MTGREQLEYMERRKQVLLRAGWVCEIPDCNNRLSFDTYQMAHIIGKGKTNMRLYGKAVIHHPLNIKATCGDACNRLASCGSHTAEIKELVEQIRAAIKGEL